jgi:hypothetical protein
MTHSLIRNNHAIPHRRGISFKGSLLMKTVASLALTSCVCGVGAAQPSEGQPNGAAKPIPPQKSPVYSKLKNLYHMTELVKNGQPNAALVIGSQERGLQERYRVEAEAIQQAIVARTGVTLPIMSDGDAQATVPLQRNVILLGNRSTNQLVSKLYDLFYTFTDLRYPGPHGFEVRTLHNPFGNGINAVIIGGSDDIGVSTAAQRFVTRLTEVEPQNGTLALGRLMDIKLGEGIVAPRELKDFRIWEASRPGGYGEAGYFGWNSISKRMAMYYMTGDEFQAREAIRLSFPDAKAKQEISQTDAELIEDKNDPLAGPYHYGATHMILMWDLIEESPIFTDEERLKVTNAFSRQLEFRKTADEGDIYSLTRPERDIGSRHGLFSALSLLSLARYFDKDYPEPVWDQTLRGVQNFFAPLQQEQPWIRGESDNLFWLTSIISPVFTYMLLSGDHKVIHPKALSTLLQSQEIIQNGTGGDINLRTASLDLYNKAAYLTGDGRWLTYRKRIQPDPNVFRLGQSFWPDSGIQPVEPVDLFNRWTVTPLAPFQYQARATGFPFEQSFNNASFRTTSGADGDYVLLDGMNGGGRNPYHTFAILDLRINGQTLLNGYLNQVMTKADGMVEPKVALDGILRYSDVIGQTAAAIGEVPNSPYSNWKRTLAHRTGRYALIVDDLTFRTDSQNFESQFLWHQKDAATWTVEGNSLYLMQPKASKPSGQVVYSDPMQTVVKGNVAELYWRAPVKNGSRRTFFSLVGPGGQTPDAALKCIRVTHNATALHLPQAALAVAGNYQNTSGELAVLATDHLFGRNLTIAGLDSTIIKSDSPVHLDWDFTTGQLSVVAERAVNLELLLPTGAQLRSADRTLTTTTNGNLTRLALPAGRHTITGVQPNAVELASLTRQLTDLSASDNPPTGASQTGAGARTIAASLQERFTVPIQGDVQAYATAQTKDGQRFYASNDKTIQAFDAQGNLTGTMQADGSVVVLHWWPEQQLLIAGCIDEKVIAFDTSGRRVWTFISEMDPAVFRSAKQYWFKTAPGYAGVHGLDSGVFIDGKSQLFVGSACTLEIVDENGKLIKRLPQYWGPVHKFKIMPKPDGSLDLLMARRLTDLPNLGVVNNRKVATDYNVHAAYNYASPENYRFTGVPAGYTPVNGWADQTRFHIFHLDVDGDGKKEIVSEVTGAWNRITVWDENAKPKYTAYFGPGENVFNGNGASVRFPKPPIRDMDIADVNGDGKPEILVALSNGLVVALDGQCRKLWSTDLKTTPSVIKIVGRNIVTGCEQGDVIVLDNKGQVTQRGTTGGNVTVIDRIDDETVLVGAAGGVKAFALTANPIGKLQTAQTPVEHHSPAHSRAKSKVAVLQ